MVLQQAATVGWACTPNRVHRSPLSLSVALLHAVNACIAMQPVGCAHNHSGPIHSVLKTVISGFLYTVPFTPLCNVGMKLETLKRLYALLRHCAHD